MLLFVFLLVGCLQHISGMPSFAADCLREHNKVRANHGAPPLKWDPVLTRHAQQWADYLDKKARSAASGVPPGIHAKATGEGENVASMMNPTCMIAVEDWADEFYDYQDLGYCRRAPRRPAYYLMHFTQLVWKKTTKLGVGISGNYLVARYSPKGNSYRHYGSNVQC